MLGFPPVVCFLSLSFPGPELVVRHVVRVYGTKASKIPPPVFIPVGRRVPNTKWSPARPPRNKCRCPLQPAESFLARARAPPGARSDSVDVRARRPSPLHPAGPCSATPPALRLLPCAPLDVGRKDRFPLGTRLREDRARVVNAARARSPFPGTPVAVTWDPRLKTARSTARAPPLLLLPHMAP